MTVTQKIEVGISSNLLHSISTSICIRKCNKNWESFFGHFLEKSMDYSTVNFLFKMHTYTHIHAHTSRLYSSCVGETVDAS